MRWEHERTRLLREIVDGRNEAQQRQLDLEQRLHSAMQELKQFETVNVMADLGNTSRIGVLEQEKRILTEQVLFDNGCHLKRV